MGAGGSTTLAVDEPDKASLDRLRAMWPVGVKCTIHGLQSAAGQQLNGLTAQVEGIDAETGRLILRTDAAAPCKKVKPENANWDGVALNLTGEHGQLVGEIQALVQSAASCPIAVEASQASLLQEKMAEALEVLPAAELVLLQSFVQQAHSHASRWCCFHEFRINPEMKFEGPHRIVSTADPRHKELHEKIASTMKRAYCDAAREALAKPEPDFAFLHARVEELVGSMASVLPVARRAGLRERTVDMQMLRTQLDNHAFDYPALIDLTQRLGGALMELESPYQSALTRAWLDEQAGKPAPDEAGFREAVVDTLAYLFEKVDIMKVEIENFGLQQARVTKLQEVERATFNQMVQTGIVQLDGTRSWLAASEHGGDVDLAIVRGMARLLSQKAALPPDACPEPMRCDIRRLHEFQSGLQGVALLGLVAIAVTPFLPGGIAPEDAAPLFKAVAEEFDKPDLSIARICEIVEQHLSDLRHTRGEPPVDFQRLDAAFEGLRKCLGEDVPVYRLLHDRALKAFDAGMGPPKRQVESTCMGENPWPLRFAAGYLNSVVAKVWIYLVEHLRVYHSVYREAFTAGPSTEAGDS